MKKLINFKKLAVIIMALALALCTVGCGGGAENDQTTQGAAQIAGSTETWGNITVIVPDGMKIVPGDLFDKESKDALTVQSNDDAFKFISIAIKDSDSIDMGLDMTKEINSDCTFTDESFTLSNGTFAGFSYVSFDTECIQLKGTLGDKFIQVGADGFKSDDTTFRAVLESIVLK